MSALSDSAKTILYHGAPVHRPYLQEQSQAVVQDQSQHHTSAW